MKAIKILRAEARMSSAELGRLSGVGRATISRLENGKVKPHPATVGRIADALGIDATDIYLMEEMLSRPKAQGPEQPRSSDETGLLLAEYVIRSRQTERTRVLAKQGERKVTRRSAEEGTIRRRKTSTREGDVTTR
jgi:transcriptional regulator with XRE-family HTH domain